MKIYQLHKYGGIYGDYNDYVIGSYLRRERAEEEKVKAEAKEKKLMERDEKCGTCPFFDCAPSELNDLIVEYADYCAEAKLIKGRFGIECENFYTHFDDATFEVEEVEVEE